MIINMCNIHRMKDRKKLRQLYLLSKVMIMIIHKKILQIMAKSKHYGSFFNVSFDVFHCNIILMI